MECVNDSEFLDRFLRVERPGADKILAFYDSTVDAICRNGRYLYIPLSDHLCHRGDALFESISVCDGYVFSMEGHLERLKKGCASFMQIQPPCSWEDLRQRIVDVARAGGERDCGIRLFLGRGAGGFGVSPLECPKTSLYIVAVRQPKASEELYEKVMTAFTSKVPPKL